MSLSALGRYDTQRLSEQLTQENHGFTVLTGIRYDTITSDWVKALADSEANVATHLVVKVFDLNTFEAAERGSFTLDAAHGLTPLGTQYYLDASTAGDYTSTAPAIAQGLFTTTGTETIQVNVWGNSIDLGVETITESTVIDNTSLNTSAVEELRYDLGKFLKTELHRRAVSSASISANSAIDYTIPVLGVGSAIQPNCALSITRTAGTSSSIVIADYWISDNNEVTLRLFNTTGSSASATFNILIEVRFYDQW